MVLNTKELKKMREDAKITQAELAKVTGLHVSAITRIESGKFDCRLSTLELLADGLEILKNSKLRKLTGTIIISESDFQNTAYKSMVRMLESAERDGKYKGNGHHLTQRLVELLVKDFIGSD